MPNPSKAPRKRSSFKRSHKDLMSRITIDEQQPGKPIGPPIDEFELVGVWPSRSSAIRAAKEFVDIRDRKIHIRKRPAAFSRGSVYILHIEKGKFAPKFASR
jgi:hypothetical protein